MNKKILVLGAIFGGLSVVFGAFGAHGLKDLVSAESVNVFETGVRYQMYHALLLLFIGNTKILSDKTKKALFILVLIGVLLFSGSIYGLSTNALTTFDFKVIGFVTPIGGLFLISAWFLLLIKFLKNKLDISKN